MRRWFRFVGLLFAHWPRAALALLCAALACTLSLSGPWIGLRLLKAAEASGGASLVWLALLLLSAACAQAIAGGASSWLTGRLAIDIGRQLRLRCCRTLLRLPQSWFDRTLAGSILTRLVDDVAALQSLATGPALVTLFDAITAAGAALWLTRVSWQMGLVLAACAGLYYFVARRYTARIRLGTQQVRQELDAVFGHLKERIDGMLVVRASASEGAEVAKFTRQMETLHEPRVNVAAAAIDFSSLTMAIAGLGAAAVFAIACHELLHGRMTSAEVAMACALVGLVMAPLARLSELAGSCQQARASFARIDEILGPSQPCEPPSAGVVPRWHARGAIEFDRVCFAYEPGQPVLRDVSMTIEPGSTVAIVGPSGSGKSTLASLLLKLYEPTAGEIRIGGFPLAMIAESQFRGQIGLVPQDPVVFRATLADNIRYAAPRATDDEVLRSAHAALLAPLLQKLPTGLATLVGEGGHPLSQGERQRIAIARLLCQDPAIVVLDEATSALDQDCEAHVQEALARLLAGRTTIVIAHRLATIERADAIVVMDQGQIVQQGTHEQLLADRSGLYFQLYTSQFARQAARARARHPGHLQPAQTTYEPVPA